MSGINIYTFFQKGLNWKKLKSDSRVPIVYIKIQKIMNFVQKLFTHKAFFKILHVLFLKNLFSSKYKNNIAWKMRLVYFEYL